MYSLGEQIRERREANSWTQNELATRCNLDIRTIQRIETGKVSPRLYTLKIIENILDEDFSRNPEIRDDSIHEYRHKFKQRKTARIVIAFSATFLMLLAALASLNSWVLFGVPKQSWSPYYVGLMCLHLIGIGIVWRCPGCNTILGEVFSTQYCNKCGLRLHE